MANTFISPYSIKTYPSPYSLDEIIDGFGSFVAFALTRKNIDFIETVVPLDSNYKTQYSKSLSQPGADFYYYVKKYPSVASTKTGSGKGWAKGSINYWYNQLQSGAKFTYEQSLFAIVSIIDSLNSTHLNACKDGRAKMTELIVNNWGKDFKSLCSTLDKNNPRSVYSLSNVKLGGKRYNFSFASKIYFYLHERFAKSNSLYPVSKYDQIVAKNLDKYVKTYLPSKKGKNSYLISNAPNVNEKQKRYENYQNDIGDIINSLKIKIDRKEFDHLVWWTSK